MDILSSITSVDLKKSIQPVILIRRQMWHKIACKGIPSICINPVRILSKSNASPIKLFSMPFHAACELPREGIGRKGKHNLQSYADFLPLWLPLPAQRNEGESFIVNGIMSRIVLLFVM